MQFQANFGRVGKPVALTREESSKFRLAVLGDFSGRANKGQLETGEALAQRKPLVVDFDNIDEIIERLGIELNIPVGAKGSAHIQIRSMDDFHPDELYDNLEIFEEIANLRQRLSSTSSFASAAKEVQEWLGDEALRKPHKYKAPSRGATIPIDCKLSDFAQLIGQPAVDTEPEHALLEDLLKSAVAPYIEPSADPQQAAMVAAVDQALSGMLASILHHPDFQAMESLWRSVDLLTRSLETGVDLEIVLFDLSAEEIAADLSGADNLSATGLYKLLVEQPSLDAQQGPLSVIAACYTFEQTPPHAELLGRIAQIVANSSTPFIASIGSDCLKKTNAKDLHPLVRESWDALRSMPHAVYLGLTVPRFMLRTPYGAKGEPIEPFEFEEFNTKDGLRSMLWGHSSILTALLLARSFSEQGSMTGMQIDANMNVKDLPFHYYVDADGDQIALPCTERLFTMTVAEQLISQGFMPILAIKGNPNVRLASWASLNGATLAGPWAPVSITEPEPAAAEPEPAAAEPEPAAAEPEPAAAESGSTAAEPEPTVEATESEAAQEDSADSELDDLLASLSDDDETEDDDEMDPELAALLADL